MLTATQFSLDGAKASAIVRARRTQARQSRVLALRVAGMPMVDIQRQLGISKRTLYRDMEALEAAGSIDACDEILQDAGIDGEDLHITLSMMHDADLADIIVDPSVPLTEIEYKPIEQWPEIWRRGLAGKIRITPVSLRSSDGVQAGESKSWDHAGYKVEIERESLLKIMELAAKLKQVDALVKPSDVQIEQNVEINITWTTPEDKAAEARIIDVAATKLIK